MAKHFCISLSNAAFCDILPIHSDIRDHVVINVHSILSHGMKAKLFGRRLQCAQPQREVSTLAIIA